MALGSRQIVAFGGGGFSMEWGNTLLDDFVLGLTDAERPRVCFLPTASGDADHYVVRFYRAFSAERCEPSHISLFRRETGVGDPRGHLLAQDLIYVGGGSLVSLLGTWRAHGLDEILREAWEAGVILCGGSAGALCWFENALSGFHEGPSRQIEALGLLPASCAVHYNEEQGRREAYLRAVAEGMPAGYGVGDSAALHFIGTELAEVVSSRPQASAARVLADRNGGACEQSLPVRYLGLSAVDELPDAAIAAEAGDPRQILAMGGGGFTMPEHDQSDALDRLVLELTGAPVPRVCFLPTASGDPRDQVTRFYERFGDWPCEPSILSLFHLGRDRIDPIAHILEQDALYIGGGSMRNMLAIWREHGIDEAMRTAWHRGVVLAGLSAGAMCWFEGGVSMSGGQPEVVHGIGLLPGSLSVHLDGEPERQPVYERAVGTGALPPGDAADDGAAVIYRGTLLTERAASRPGARVMRIEADGSGGALCHAEPVRLLPDALGEPLGDLARESDGVSEMRALRAGRNRWE